MIPPERSFVLVDEGLKLPRSIASRGPLSFPGLNGRPAGDQDAIEKLETLRQAGTEFIAFLWPAFSWIERYSGFDHYLRNKYRPVLENDRALVFDLASPP